jgi:hypothetical protein
LAQRHGTELDARVDKRRIGLFENPEQRQTSPGGEDDLVARQNRVIGR